MGRRFLCFYLPVFPVAGSGAIEMQLVANPKIPGVEAVLLGEIYCTSKAATKDIGVRVHSSTGREALHTHEIFYG